MLSMSIIWFLCWLLASSVLADEEVLLDIPQGTLKGIKASTVLQKVPFYSFVGIRYAKPLNMETRYKVAEPAEPWQGVYDATEQGSECLGWCMVREIVIGSDDCLFANVFTPNLNKDAKKAVLVWFHGGYFNVGSAEKGFYGPDFLMEQDIVLVVINYRLGAIGFFSTEDAAAPGNLGLKDQTAALKWVQNNIQYFGGCPNRVTIAGQSAGAAAVQYHMLSPMSAGLFAQAIAQCGAAISPWAITHHPRKAAFKLGEVLGIKTTDSVELMKGLANIPSETIVEAAMTVDETENYMNGQRHAFVPSIESDFGQEIFLPTDPWELIKAGKFANVPYMAGLNLNETLFLMSDFTEHANFMNEHFENFIPDDLNITDATEQKKITDSMRKFYFDNKPLTNDMLQEWVEMTSDIMFSWGVELTTRIINSITSSPTFFYLYAHESPLGIFKDVDIIDIEGGAIHGDELSYMFFSSLFRAAPKPGSIEEHMVRIIAKLWGNFVKTGNPTPTLDNDIKLNWEPMGKENNYIIIDQDLRMEKNMFKERRDFWVSIYKDIIGDYANLF